MPVLFFVYSDRKAKTPLPIGKGVFGASDVTRTRDLLITNQLHYRLCYTSKYMGDKLSPI